MGYGAPAAPATADAGYGAPAGATQAGYGTSGYGAPAYGTPGYVAPAYGTAPSKPTPVYSLISLIAGIVGVVGSFVVFIPFVGGFMQLFIPGAAVVLGFIGKRKEPAAKGMWLTGLVLGFVGLGIALLSFILWGLLFGASSVDSTTF